MDKITLTTVVSGPATLNTLLKITDRLYESGKLTSLRIVDKTHSNEDSVHVKSFLKSYGDEGRNIVNVDTAVVKAKDPHAVVFSRLADYHYQSTSKVLCPGSSITVLVHGSGAHVHLGGPELVAGPGGCFIRAGKGGGRVIASMESSGVVDGGLGWRALHLSLSYDKILVVEADTGDMMSMPTSRDEIPLSISAMVNGVSDIILTSLNVADMSEQPRIYASYYRNFPEPTDGVEVRSTKDIVYIDIAGWDEVLAQNGVPLVVGDSDCFAIFRRCRLLDKSDSTEMHHTSFLNSSKKYFDRLSTMRRDGVKLAAVSSAVSTPVQIGVPVLFAVLNEDNAKFLAGYDLLLDVGPVGEDLHPAADHVLAYLDSILAGSDAQIESFLSEVIEALPLTRRKKFLEFVESHLKTT